MPLTIGPVKVRPPEEHAAHLAEVEAALARARALLARPGPITRAALTAALTPSTPEA